MDFDEKTMIREQERLEKEKKRKKNKKIRRIIFLVVFLVICSVAGILVWRSKTGGQENTAVKVVVEAGQEMVIAKITQISGNEITYVVGDVAQDKGSQGSDMGNPPEGMEMPEGMERPDMGSLPEGMEMPEGMERPDMGSLPEGMEMPEGMELPDMGSLPEGMEMPEGMELPDMGSFPGGMEMPEGMERPDMSWSQGQEGGTQGRGNGQGSRGDGQMSVTTEDGVMYDGTMYKMGEESFTTYIPVGTVVTTKLGTQTTFSRLAAGDYVALVVEGQGDDQVIVAVYIIG